MQKGPIGSSRNMSMCKGVIIILVPGLGVRAPGTPGLWAQSVRHLLSLQHQAGVSARKLNRPNSSTTRFPFSWVLRGPLLPKRNHYKEGARRGQDLGYVIINLIPQGIPIYSSLATCWITVVSSDALDTVVPSIVVTGAHGNINTVSLTTRVACSRLRCLGFAGLCSAQGEPRRRGRRGSLRPGPLRVKQAALLHALPAHHAVGRTSAQHTGRPTACQIIILCQGLDARIPRCSSASSLHRQRKPPGPTTQMKGIGRVQGRTIADDRLRPGQQWALALEKGLDR